MKSSGLLHTLHCLYKGQSIARILMNRALAKESVSGLVVDVGGGRRPDYFSYLQGVSSAYIEPLDLSISGIDLETDTLPYTNQSVDTVLLCNVLEHIYNYQYVLGEVSRILKPSGRLIGVVPFWVGYHPDPRDYFRYTKEALERILSDAGYGDIRVVPLNVGPLLANFNTIVLSVPRVLRPILYLWYASWNTLFLTLRPESAVRQPLGYIFTAGVK